jgi:hypothetical protein
MKIEDNYLRVATIRNSMLFTYNKNGSLIKKENVDKKVYYSFNLENDYQFKDSNNNVYKIKNPLLLYPYIQRESPSGKKTIIVANPFLSWVLMNPYPSWHFLFIGMILISPDLNRLRKRLMIKADRE